VLSGPLTRRCAAAVAERRRLARARCATVSVSVVRDTTVRREVEDDGVGFGAPESSFAYGLAGMRDRVVALGGRLHLENGTSGGQWVVVELPLPATAAPQMPAPGAPRRREP
jgi:signal transduction histidine kinase